MSSNSREIPSNGGNASSERWAFFLVLAIFALISLVFLVSSLNWPLCHDASHFHYVANEIRQGAVPYRDFWDTNFPGTFLVHWLLLAIPGDMDLVWRVFDLGLLAGICSLVYLLALPDGRYIAVFAPIAMANWYLSQGSSFTGERDNVVAFFELAGVYLLLLRGSSLGVEVDQWRLIASGACFGLAATIKPFAGLTFGLCMLTYLQQFWSREKWRTCAHIGIASVAGFVLGLAIVGVWLVAHGGGSFFLNTLLEFTLPVYSKLGNLHAGRASQVAMMVANLCKPYIINLVVLVLIAQLATWCAGSTKTPFRTKMLLSAALGGIGHLVLQWKFFVYHCSPFYVFALIIATHYVALLLAQFDKRLAWAAPGMALALCAFSLPTFAERTVEMWNGTYQRTLSERDYSPKLIQYLEAHVEAGETVQYLGSVNSGAKNALVHMRVRQPTPLLYDFWVCCADPAKPFVQHRRAEFMDQLCKGRPKLIVVDKDSWPYLGDGYDRLNALPELPRWLDDNYRVDVETKTYKIYRRN